MEVIFGVSEFLVDKATRKKSGSLTEFFRPLLKSSQLWLYLFVINLSTTVHVRTKNYLG